MKTPTHTSGPWHVDLKTISDVESSKGTIAIAIRRSASYTIESGHGLVADIPREEARANAQLIASAPELLSALKSIMGCRRSGLEKKEESAKWEFAKTAIAKAEGRAE